MSDRTVTISEILVRPCNCGTLNGACCERCHDLFKLGVASAAPALPEQGAPTRLDAAVRSCEFAAAHLDFAGDAENRRWFEMGVAALADELRAAPPEQGAGKPFVEVTMHDGRVLVVRDFRVQQVTDAQKREFLGLVAQSIGLATPPAAPPEQGAGEPEAWQYWNDEYKEWRNWPDGAGDPKKSIHRLRPLYAAPPAAPSEREAVIGFVREFADEPCVYGDNCADFVKANHGRCLPCKARRALTQSPTTGATE